jgi:hypothetical protein
LLDRDGADKALQGGQRATRRRRHGTDRSALANGNHDGKSLHSRSGRAGAMNPGRAALRRVSAPPTSPRAVGRCTNGAPSKPCFASDRPSQSVAVMSTPRPRRPTRPWPPCSTLAVPRVPGERTAFESSPGLQARGPPERIVDSLLPARPIVLKMRNQIAIELDRHQFLGDRDSTFFRRADGLCCGWRRWFEHSFGYGQGVGRSIPVRWSRHANCSIERLADSAWPSPQNQWDGSPSIQNAKNI